MHRGCVTTIALKQSPMLPTVPLHESFSRTPLLRHIHAVFSRDHTRRRMLNAAAILRVQSTGRERTGTQQRGAHAVVWGAWKWLRPVARTKAALHLCCSESERPDQGSTAEGPNNNAGIPPQPHSRMRA